MKRKIQLIILLLVICSIIIYVSIRVLVNSEFSKHRNSQANSEKFDKVKWSNGDRRTRGRMVHYFVDSIGVIGKDRNSIIFLLGNPDDSWIADTASHATAINYTVDLGETYLFFLNIHFNEKNIATRVDIQD